MQVRMVQRKLASGRRWADEVARCSISIRSGRVPKVSFGVAERLVGTDPVPCIEPHLSFLKVLQSGRFSSSGVVEGAVVSGCGWFLTTRMLLGTFSCSS